MATARLHSWVKLSVDIQIHTAAQTGRISAGYSEHGTVFDIVRLLKTFTAPNVAPCRCELSVRDSVDSSRPERAVECFRTTIAG